MNNTPSPNLVGSSVERRVCGGYVNVNGLKKVGMCEKLKVVGGWLESERFDFVILAETFRRQEQALRSSPYFVAMSSAPEGGGYRGGVCLLARSWLRNAMTAVEFGENWVVLEAGGMRLSGVYFPPSWAVCELEKVLEAVGEIDVLVGDVNVELGWAGGGSGEGKPADRFDSLSEWLAQHAMVISDPSAGSSKLDHVFRHQDFTLQHVITDKSSLGFSTDHPLLTLIFDLKSPTNGRVKEEKGAERFHVSREVAKEFREAFRQVAPVLEEAVKMSQSEMKKAQTIERRQDIVDFLDAAVMAVIEEVSRSVLGTYYATELRKKRDFEGERLAKCEGPVEAMRLWKRSMRGRSPKVVSEKESLKTPAEEAREVWGKVFGADEPEPDRPEFEWCEFDEKGGELGALFSEKALRRAVQEYGKHKSAGKPRHSPKRSQPPAHFLIPTQPPPNSSLSPLATPFTPTPPPSSASSTTSTEDEEDEDFPLLRILSALFVLSAAVQLLPQRWGSLLITFISKLKDKTVSPVAEQLRPIALLAMFRRLFEILLLPHLTHGGPWSRLHPHQAGFTKGWSCASSILAVDHHVNHGYPYLTLLDFKGASGAETTLVVNGAKGEAFPRRNGFPQGGPASPILFDLFIDELVVELNKDKGGKGFFYADDGANMPKCESLAPGNRTIGERDGP